LGGLGRYYFSVCSGLRGGRRGGRTEYKASHLPHSKRKKMQEKEDQGKKKRRSYKHQDETFIGMSLAAGEKRGEKGKILATTIRSLSGQKEKKIDKRRRMKKRGNNDMLENFAGQLFPGGKRGRRASLPSCASLIGGKGARGFGEKGKRKLHPASLSSLNREEEGQDVDLPVPVESNRKGDFQEKRRKKSPSSRCLYIAASLSKRREGERYISEFLQRKKKKGERPKKKEAKPFCIFIRCNRLGERIGV